MIEDTNEARMREAQDTKDSVKESVYLKINMITIPRSDSLQSTTTRIATIE